MENLGLYLLRAFLITGAIAASWVVLTILAILVSFVIDFKIETF